MVIADYTSALPPGQPPDAADVPTVERSELARVLDLADAHSEPLLTRLQEYNRTGRPPYPVRAMWRAVLSKYLLSIDYNVELVAQLRTDSALRDACGFDDVSGGGSTPNESIVCRFFKRLSEHRDLVDDALRGLTDELAKAIDERREDGDPAAGRVMAIDSTDVRSFSDSRLEVSTDPDARWGHRTPKTPGGKKDDLGEKDEFFFGFKMHTVCDAHWGFPVDYVLLPANRNDSPVLPVVMEKALENHPDLKPRYLAGDRGYDAKTNYEWLDERRIRSVIQMRHAANEDTSIYTRDGVPKCLGGKPMEYVRSERGKGHLFRCPDGGCHLKGRVMVTAFCDTEYYENPEVNPDFLRRVGRLRRASDRWKELYKKRTTVERLFRSLKSSRLLDLHRYRGMVKVGLHVALSNLTCVATMLMRAVEGDLERIRIMRVSANGGRG